MIPKYFIYVFYTMVNKNIPPGRVKYYLPATKPQFTAPSREFNTNNYTIRAQKIKQFTNGSMLTRRSNLPLSNPNHNNIK